ncbi:MAG TPA: hypothetical protein VES59_00050 [Bacteroidota bacterium]|nr:hypothetical protein [Bacteroidota bacterium]
MRFPHYDIFFIPILISLLITPLVIKFATRVGALDQPNERKVHRYPIPRLGGIAIYISFCLSLIVSVNLYPTLHAFQQMDPHRVVMLVASLTLVLALGIWDDLRPLSPGRKLIGQCLAATIVYLAGFRISVVTQPLSADLFNLGILDFPVTLLWIVGVTNAFNLIDGLDGLASGVACIVSLTIFTISFMKGDLATATMALVLGGSVLGFLRYNFNKARIFLGDSGSLFLGFTLAILSIQSSTKGSAAFSLIVPFLALGLPIMDTFLSMTRRLLRSVFPGEGKSESAMKKMLSIFLPDRGHIHHQLVARGLSHRNVVLLLYMVSCLFGLCALAITLSNDFTASAIMIAIGIATFIGVRQLQYREMAVLRNGALLPLYEWPLMSSTAFQGFLDLAFVVCSFCIAFLLAGETEMFFRIDLPFARTLALVSVLQISVISLSGLHKATFRQLAMGDLLKVLKTCAAAAIVSWVGLTLSPQSWHSYNANVIILDFYVLLSLVLGSRISFHILNYLSRVEKQNGGRKVLIYGAHPKGMAIVQTILNDDHIHLKPVGFLDEDPRLEGKRLSGYPIFGGHWKLPRLLRKMTINEIILAEDNVHPEIMQRMVDATRGHGIAIRTFRVSLEDIREENDVTSPLQAEFAFIKPRPSSSRP